MDFQNIKLFLKNYDEKKMRILISLTNPYKLDEKNLLTRLYEAYPNFGAIPIIKKLIIPKYFLYAMSLIGNIYGLKKLNKKSMCCFAPH